MEPIDYFAWIISIVLGVVFISSLAILSRKPRLFSENRKKSSEVNK
ncbi:hypothetical protein [Bacillus badius]|nr:hypothetical protein [Bacillus badius]MED4717962.1 hypothetical protein [Bacillus badius]TDW04717.1 hypothetical protein B0G66_102145 [Bacillus badius]GLY09696.1 hypothetical protein Bbad01_09120 [Bacillus badius]